MSRVTLDELLKEVGVSLTQLDKACTSEHLQDIALFLPSWRIVASHLSLSDVDVEGVEMEGRSESEKRLKVLKVWKDRSAFKATYTELVKVFLKIGNADQAMKVCRLLVPQQANEGNLYHEYMGGNNWPVYSCIMCIPSQCTATAIGFESWIWLVHAYSLPKKAG